MSPFLLSDYFSQHLGEYLNVLSALEKLNVAILKAMDKTKEVRKLNPILINRKISDDGSISL